MKHALIALVTLSGVSMTAWATEPSVKVVNTFIHNNGDDCKATKGNIYMPGVPLMRTDYCPGSACHGESLTWSITSLCKQTFVVFVRNFRRVDDAYDCKNNPPGTVTSLCSGGTQEKQLKGLQGSSPQSVKLSCEIKATQVTGGKYCYDIGVLDPDGRTLIFDQVMMRPLPGAKSPLADIVFDPEIKIRRP